MTSYGSPWPLVFILVSILFIPLVELIRRTLSIKVPSWRPAVGTILFWLSSFTLFMIFDLITYRGGTIEFIRMQETINAIIILTVTGNTWIIAPSKTPSKTPLPIIYSLMGILSTGYGFATFSSPWFEANPVWTRSVVVYIGFGLFLIIIGIIGGIIFVYSSLQKRPSLASISSSATLDTYDEELARDLSKQKLMHQLSLPVQILPTN